MQSEKNAMSAVDGKSPTRVLPKGWQWRRLADVSEVIAGQSPPGKSYNTAGVGAEFHQGKVAFGYKTLKDSGKWTTESRRSAEAGDIVMSIRAPVGPVNLVDRSVAIGRGLAAIRVNPGMLSTDWLFYHMRNIESELTGTQGSTFASINKGQIEEIRVPLAPLREQRRIVRAVEGRLETIAKAKLAAETQLEAAESMAAAYLRTVFPKQGEELPNGWRWIRLGDGSAFQIISGGTPSTKRPEYWDGGVPWITLVDLPVEDLVASISLTQRSISELGLSRSAAKLIPIDSVVISTRATIGRIGINRIPIATNQGFKSVVPVDRSRISAEFVAFCMTQKVAELQGMASGATYGDVTKSSLMRIRVPIPSMRVQERVVGAIRDRLASLDSAIQVSRSQQEAIECLHSTYINQAFSGAL